MGSYAAEDGPGVGFYVDLALGVGLSADFAVVHVDVMEAEFQIGVNGKSSWAVCVITQGNIPDRHRIVYGDKELLFGMNAAIITEVFDVAQAVTAAVKFLGLVHRLNCVFVGM